MPRFPAVFLDRDGVIIENRANYVRSWDDVSFLTGVFRVLRRLFESAYRIVIVTNQLAQNVTIGSAASPGTSSLSISSGVASSPSGGSIALSLSNGSFTVNAPPFTNTPPPSPTATTKPQNTEAPTIPPLPSSTSSPAPKSGPIKTSTIQNVNSPTAPATYSSTPIPTRTPTKTRQYIVASTKSPTQTNPNSSPILPTATTGQAGTATTMNTFNPSPTWSSTEGIGEDYLKIAIRPNPMNVAAEATSTALADIEAQVEATGTAIGLNSSNHSGAHGSQGENNSGRISISSQFISAVGIASVVVLIAISLTTFGAIIWVAVKRI